MTVTPEQVRELITAVGLDHRAADIMAMLQPSIAIHTNPSDDSTIPLGQSKFGGMPDLPPDIAWPDYQGRPLDFVAQINLADVAPFDHDKRLPTSGRLYFYFDERKYYEDELWRNHGKGSYHVIYGEEQLPIDRRSELNQLERSHEYHACLLNFIEEFTLPSFESYQISKRWGWTYRNFKEHERDIEAYVELMKQVGALYPSENHVHNRIFGYPDLIQGDVMIEAEEAANNLVSTQEIYDQRGTEIQNWQLLLQIGSDDNAKMMWGDVGILYFCIQANALHERRFDQAVCMFQYS